MPKIKFVIYIAGMTATNQGTLNSFREVCEDLFSKNSFEIMVEDILVDSTLADKHKILAIPTIIRLKPQPEKRIIGEFRNPDAAREALQYLTTDLPIKI